MSLSCAQIGSTVNDLTNRGGRPGQVTLHIWDPEQPELAVCGERYPANTVSPLFAKRLDFELLCPECSRWLVNDGGSPAAAADRPYEPIP